MYGETRGARWVCRVRVSVEWTCESGPRGRDLSRDKLMSRNCNRVHSKLSNMFASSCPATISSSSVSFSFSVSLCVCVSLYVYGGGAVYIFRSLSPLSSLAPFIYPSLTLPTSSPTTPNSLPLPPLAPLSPPSPTDLRRHSLLDRPRLEPDDTVRTKGRRWVGDIFPDDISQLPHRVVPCRPCLHLSLRHRRQCHTTRCQPRCDTDICFVGCVCAVCVLYVCYLVYVAHYAIAEGMRRCGVCV